MEEEPGYCWDDVGGQGPRSRQHKSCIMKRGLGDVELHAPIRKRYNHKYVESRIGFASWQIVDVS